MFRVFRVLKEFNFKDSRVVPKDFKDFKDPKDLRDLKSQPRPLNNLSPGSRSASAQAVDQPFQRFFHRFFGGVYRDLGIQRRFVGIINSGERFYFAAPRLFVKPFDIAFFADFKRSRDIDFDKISAHFPHKIA